MSTERFDLGPDLLPGPGAPDGVRIRADSLPASTWGSNLRGILSRKEWDRLRIATAEAAEGRCQACGVRSRRTRPHCHEKWVFEIVDRIPVQRLAGLVALCVACHRVQHIGLAGVRGELPLVKRQLSRVNGWRLDEVVADLRRAEDRSRRLEPFGWDLDLRILAGQVVIPGWPDLLIPEAGRDYLGNAFRKASRPMRD